MDAQAAKAAREWGEAGRKLRVSQRVELRNLLALHAKAPKKFTLTDIANRVGCSLRTAQREARWMRAEIYDA